MGTMCESVLEYIRKEKGHKQVVLVINKCDLVPNWVTVRPAFSISLKSHRRCRQGTDLFIYLMNAVGEIYPAPYPTLPHHRIPRLTEPLLRERLPHTAAPPILATAL